jgi:peptidyl-prolyl cis-trans isomerase C
MDRLALACALACALASCRRPATDRSTQAGWPMIADAPASDEVVATVDGRPIRASDIRVQAAAAGSSAKQALDDLITAETLAGEAARRHFDRAPEVKEAARAESVRRLLALDFEKETTADAIPSAITRSYYFHYRNLFDHSEYVDVWHILVPLPKQASPALRTAARATAEDLARRAKGISLDAFRALATQEKPPAGIAPLKLEEIVTARDGWTLTSFSYPAFELTRPGQTSGVVETSYGFHVIYYVRRIPPRHLSPDEAAPEIRARLFPSFERDQLKQYLERAKRRHQVAEYPDHLPPGDDAPKIP